jgi:ubiquinone/menaquinone biosynthesis C-methylase UbiE
MEEKWTSDRVLEGARAYQPACVMLAAAELDVVGMLARGPRSAGELADVIRSDERATIILADALTALGLLEKRGEVYSPAPGVAELFVEDEPGSVVPMLRHQANCLRSWAQLAEVVRSGRPHERPPSVRGASGDQSAFIEAMEVASREIAAEVVAGLAPLVFEHLLDVGGGPGTWTVAFLRANRQARATLYDLPEVIPIARKHIESAKLSDRVSFVEGDFTVDEALLSGADLIWISAIAHQNSRQQNREIYAKAYRALRPGGRIMIRDIVMDETRTTPTFGAMFAVNMLVNTEGGRTYSLQETTEELRHAGFGEPEVIRGPRDMDSVVRASKS